LIFRRNELTSPVTAAASQIKFSAVTAPALLDSLLGG
jgi:hypothetical protein